jgi:hypothetical protein
MTQKSPPRRRAFLLVNLRARQWGRAGRMSLLRRSRCEPFASAAGLWFRLGFRRLLDFLLTFVFASHGSKCDTKGGPRERPKCPKSFVSSGPGLHFGNCFSMIRRCVRGNPWAVISTTAFGPVREAGRYGQRLPGSPQSGAGRGGGRRGKEWQPRQARILRRRARP